MFEFETPIGCFNVDYIDDEYELFDNECFCPEYTFFFNNLF